MLQTRFIHITQDLLTQRNQLAAHTQVIDRAAIILGINDRDDAGGKIGEIFRRALLSSISALKSPCSVSRYAAECDMQVASHYGWPSV
jgi:hypothetical protein